MIVGLMVAFVSIESIGLVTGDEFALNWVLAIPSFLLLGTIGMTVSYASGRLRWFRVGAVSTAAALAAALIASIAKPDSTVRSSTARRRRSRPSSDPERVVLAARPIRLAALIVVLVAGSSACGTSDSPALEAELSQASALMNALGLNVVEQAHVTESKGAQYVTATATGDGGQQTVVAHIAAGLRQSRWVIRSEQQIDTVESPATEGDEIIADAEGVVVRIAVFDRIGTRPLVEGTRWVQLSLSPPDDALLWTNA